MEETNVELYRVDPRFIVNLKGKLYPSFPGVLDAATRAGLRSLTTTIVQIPSPETNHMAVVMVRADFEDGRSFTSVGDASPANCSPGIATAALRMAETRAAGRALRAAINCGMTLLEELPDEEPAASARPSHGPPGNGHAAARPAASNPRPAPAADGTVACEQPGCGVLLTKNQVTMSQHHAKRNLCPPHLAALKTEPEPVPG